MIVRTVIILSVLGVALIEAGRFDSEEYREWQEFKEFRDWKRAKKQQEVTTLGPDSYESESGTAWKRIRNYPKNERKNYGDPPPIDQAALMGRYIVNQADWTATATISSQNGIETFPFVNIISFSDGPLGNGSGIPYLFLTPLDFTAQDMSKDHRSTLMMSLAQGDYCKTKVYDPMDPRCARIVLTGKLKALSNNTAEFQIAKNAVFGRHPWLAHMPADHHFFFAKLKIAKIAVLDTFGGPKYVTVKDYLHPPVPNVTETFLRSYPALEKTLPEEPYHFNDVDSKAPTVLNL